MWASKIRESINRGEFNEQLSVTVEKIAQSNFEGAIGILENLQQEKLKLQNESQMRALLLYISQFLNIFGYDRIRWWEKLVLQNLESKTVKVIEGMNKRKNLVNNVFIY